MLGVPPLGDEVGVRRGGGSGGDCAPLLRGGGSGGFSAPFSGDERTERRGGGSGGEDIADSYLRRGGGGGTGPKDGCLVFLHDGPLQVLGRVHEPLLFSGCGPVGAGLSSLRRICIRSVAEVCAAAIAMERDTWREGFAAGALSTWRARELMRSWMLIGLERDRAESYSSAMPCWFGTTASPTSAALSIY